MAGYCASLFFFSLITLWIASKAAISASWLFHFLDIFHWPLFLVGNNHTWVILIGREQSYLAYL